jgi:hypothetical protein
MLATRIFGAIVVASLGLAFVGAPEPAFAQGKGQKGKEKKAEAVKPAPSTKKAINVWPTKLSWGQSSKQVGSVYGDVIDLDYKPQYKKVQPGVQMQQLDAEVEEKKAAFLRSHIEFGKTPTGFDATPLKGEYTHNNKESVMSISRNGKTRYLFFIQGRLWKIVDKHPLGEKSKWGKDFATAVGKLSQYYGVPGRVLAANPEAGRRFNEVDWQDQSTHLRAVEYGDTEFALIREDAQILPQLASMRSNTVSDPNQIDPAVAAALAKPQDGDKDKDKGKDKDQKKK